MPICLLFGMGLAVSGRTSRAGEFAFAFVLCLLLASTISMVLPALGSTVYHDISGAAGLPPNAGSFHMAIVNYYKHDPAAVFDFTKTQGIVTFPSFHMVMALLLPYAVRKTPLAAAIALCWASLVALSAIVIGGHYFIDLLAGAVTWALAARLHCALSSGRNPAS